MLADFDRLCANVRLQLNLIKTVNISEYSNYVYLDLEVNIVIDLAPKLGWRKLAAWEAFKSVKEVVTTTKNV
ncbi:unnamed protein product [Heligmosomoides polygyrus]|uniref:Reverse transcriptase n=1 Tax=Heligmosomoides polygyrus TaxID=6339 RepID=A0A183FUD0_HELPZ|nr:unnamed protein product [Heligmosomoides polygyrus]